MRERKRRQADNVIRGSSFWTLSAVTSGKSSSVKEKEAMKGEKVGKISCCSAADTVLRTESTTKKGEATPAQRPRGRARRESRNGRRVENNVGCRLRADRSYQDSIKNLV